MKLLVLVILNHLDGGYDTQYIHLPDTMTMVSSLALMFGRIKVCAKKDVTAAWINMATPDPDFYLAWTACTKFTQVPIRMYARTSVYKCVHACTYALAICTC